MNYSKELIAHLEKQRSDLNAVQMKAYMRGQFEFLGIKSPQRKLLLKSFLNRNGLPQEDFFESSIKEMWQSDYREVQYCAMEIVKQKKWAKTDYGISLIEYMLIHKSWWDTVDYIASNLCGSFFKRHPNSLYMLDSWNNSDNLWLIRTSILYQLKYKSEMDLIRLEIYMNQHLNSPEFFIQKAIGWILRELSKNNKEFVKNYLQNQDLKPVSLREAKKHL